MVWFRRRRDVGYEIEENDGYRDLVITGAWTAGAAEVVRASQIDRLVLNYAKGFREPDLGFLTGLPIRGLFVLSYTLTDLAPIYSLADTLTNLSVGRLRGPIDIQRLPHLQALSTDWSSIEHSIQFAHEIQDLALGGYRPHDLRPLSHLTALRTLRMKDYPSVRTLDGAQAFSSLGTLLVALARQLVDISALKALAGTLRDLNLETCRKIPDLDPVGHCRALTSVNAANCGELPTVAPLADLQLLERLYLYESTNILDGDLNPIAALPALRDLRMMNRRHYTPSVAEIQRAIAETCASSLPGETSRHPARETSAGLSGRRSSPGHTRETRRAAPVGRGADLFSAAGAPDGTNSALQSLRDGSGAIERRRYARQRRQHDFGRYAADQGDGRIWLEILGQRRKS